MYAQGFFRSLDFPRTDNLISFFLNTLFIYMASVPGMINPGRIPCHVHVHTGLIHPTTNTEILRRTLQMVGKTA